VDKDEFFGSPYGSTFRIGAYTVGYTRDVNLFRSVETGIGANFTAYSLPGAIKPYYGNHPPAATFSSVFDSGRHRDCGAAPCPAAT